MIVTTLLLALYFLPTLVASHRGHRIGGVAVLNLLFGWTGIGWLALLFYVMAAAPRVYVTPVYQDVRYAGYERF